MRHFRSVLTEHEKPTHASKGDAHSVLGQILPILTRLKKQHIEYHAIIDAAELADDTFGPKAEFLRQILGGKEREVDTIAAAARNLVKANTQWDEQMKELRTHVERHEANGTHAG